MEFEERMLSSEYVYKGRIVSVRKDEVRLPNGCRSTREVVEHSGGVCVAPLTSDGELIFVRQFRYPYGEVLLELPAGKMDHDGENSLACGVRELQEETGATAKEYTSMGKMYPSPGCYNEVLYLYLAQGLEYGEQQPDEDEFLDVVRIPLEKAVEMVLDNEITDAKTQLGVLKTYSLLKKQLQK